jgi:hypothetical protein
VERIRLAAIALWLQVGEQESRQGRNPSHWQGPNYSPDPVGLTTKHRQCAEETRKDRVASHRNTVARSSSSCQRVEDSDPTLGVTVADARYMKPLDVDLCTPSWPTLVGSYYGRRGGIGGFGDHVLLVA